MSPFRWTHEELRSALGSELREVGGGAPSEEDSFRWVSTDTRSIEPGDLFVALRGERFDAHDFLGEAAGRGARAAVVERVPEEAPSELQLFQVADTRRALGRMARHRRRALRGRVVGVGGSNGKTTTKELLGAALGARLTVHATVGNLNNQIGVPLTLLATPDNAEAVVVEMGTNEPGEIAILAEIVEPDDAILTTIGEEHLEGLGTLEGVLEEEVALLAALNADALALVGEEPPVLPRRAREIRGGAPLRIAGLDRGADLHPEGGADGVRVMQDGSTRWRWRGVEVHLPLPGRHNVRNALLALGLAEAWGVPPEDAVRGIEAMPPPKLRGEWHRIGDLGVLADCYNANPPSLVAAVELLASLPTEGAKIAVIGTMRELGAESEAIHRRVAAQIADQVESGEIDRIVATGTFASAFGERARTLGDRLLACTDPLDAYARLSSTLKGNETILLKASRAEALERWIALLERDGGGK